MAFRISLGLAILMFRCAGTLQAENRTFDGSGNNLAAPARGAANTPFIRFSYKPQYVDGISVMFTEPARPNARTVSNTIFAQSASRPSARHLSNYIWAWGQFLTHDTDLSTSSNGAAVNGSAPIAILDAADPLGPNAIPFTRANFPPPATTTRIPINEVTSYIDGSAVYGSSGMRAAALRTNGGVGAKLLTDANNLLPRNTAGLPNENEGPVPNDQLFLAGDIRSNENSLLTSLHTILVREHNRLVDRIAAQQPGLSAEEQYQLARKLVGAEMQVITYHEFLPALLGSGQTVPKAEQYVYSSSAALQSDITTAHSVAAFRYGHSAVTPTLDLIANDGTPAGDLAVRNVFFNPNLIGNTPQLVDQLLQGAATQHSEEIDTLIVDDLRNFLFGPPGAGGLDLAALNIQRGRDVGLPNFRTLKLDYNAGQFTSFSQITSDPVLAQALATVYSNNLNIIDGWVGGLAEDHVAGASVGQFFKTEIESQFRRLRDGDRFFYRGAAAGLYANNTLDPAIAAIVDLDHVTLADIILANTSIGHLQKNVFFVPNPGDFNGDGLVDSADYITWRHSVGTENIWADADGNGTVGMEDLDLWRAHFGAGAPAQLGELPQVPEPAAIILLLSVAFALFSANNRYV